MPFADADVLANRARYTEISYDVTPPKMPVGFSLTDLKYRGEML